MYNQKRRGNTSSRTPFFIWNFDSQKDGMHMKSEKFFPKKRLSERSGNVILGTVAVLAALVLTILCVFAFGKQSQEGETGVDQKKMTIGLTTAASPEKTTPQASDPVVQTPDPEEGEEVDAPLVLFSLPTSGNLVKEQCLDSLLYSLTLNDFRTHTGVDIQTELGNAVYACADGLVADLYDDPMMGRCLVLEHDGGYRSIYKNLAEEDPDMPEVGQVVVAGQLIGRVGESALAEIAEENHLHFELYLEDCPIDPLSVLAIPTALSEGSEDE
jgi:murein DD-endopeptidase MepM/ murein hydrolase activator NlpD